MLLETLLIPGTEQRITNIFIREGITFFKINGESFCSAAGYVKHQSDHMYDSGPLKVFAAYAHDPQKKIKLDAIEEQTEYESRLWDKHKRKIYAMVVQYAAGLLLDKGEAALEDYLEAHFSMIPDDLVKLLVKKMEDDKDI